ncbi:MAG TPA: type III-B CRISPR module-associated Cmr3 family protein [Streptosporangiaceae bacterium]|nr:type III-B CRISPR module-associated Cmr3 family protein [Streptosporangiaceae bacterium]
MTAPDSQGGLMWLALRPRDTVLIRDGRSFDAASDTTAQTVRPWPSTAAGAVAAAFGAPPGATPVTKPGTVPEEVRGPVLSQRVGAAWVPYFPVPADLVRDVRDDKPYAHRLQPDPGEARTDLEEDELRWLMPPCAAGKTRPMAGWMPGAKLGEYLAGQVPAAGRGGPVSDLRLADPFKAELRVGLARELDRQAKPGFLYQATHWRLEDNWGFLAGCVLRDGWDRSAAGPVRLGGRGRLADVEAAGDVSWPARPEEFPDGQLLVYLATPAIWRGGWRIPVPESARLVAAATGEPEPVATMTPGPNWRATRALRWAVPAGSVYLLRFDDAALALRWAATWHGVAYGLEPSDQLRTAGFGVVLTGVWK